jgi:hypothetical protein
MPQDRRRTILDGRLSGPRGHGCIVAAVGLVAALISCPTGW